ncbi:peroxidase [Stachybotrys elegans]|uniref:Peroxidase n=1 Tax=Stachybotrys elegans TaxID=80388 RepID=A0A8K0WMP5_9HYPO|nr:peroxidase [Stachybotrys elegans]
MAATLDNVELTAHQNHLPASTELLGDLITLPQNRLSQSGRAIRQLLTGSGNPESNVESFFKPSVRSWWCQVDSCCVWHHIADDLENLFRGESGRCNKFARQAVRIAFHDAGTWSKATAHQGGGADGSIILSPDEMTRIENSGMSEVAAHYMRIYHRYHVDLGFRSVSMADLLQFGSSVATVVCPLGPRVRTWVGRQDSNASAPHNLLPNPFGDAASIIELFQNKTISPRGLIALLGSHTTSQQHFTNFSRPGDPQDSTPGVWDNLYFRETLGSVAVPERVYHIPADSNLAQHDTTRAGFEMYGRRGGQKQWNSDYARESIRLGLLGVNNINTMTECTRVLPRATQNFSSKDQRKIDRWLKNLDWSGVWQDVSRFLEEGHTVRVSEADLQI